MAIMPDNEQKAASSTFDLKAAMAAFDTRSIAQPSSQTVEERPQLKSGLKVKKYRMTRNWSLH